jgi:hypothetical protein
MLTSVADAPLADKPTNALMAMLRAKAPVAEVKAHLNGEFDLLARLATVPAAHHPQGFLVFKLGQAEGGHSALRFHVWSKHERIVGDQKGFQIHDHIFGFNSLLLAGSMENRSYAVTPSPTETGLRLFPVRYTAPNVDTISAEPTPVTLTRSKTEAVHAGQYYSMSAGVFHTSAVPKDQLTMTLLLATGDPRYTEPRMVGKASATLPKTNHRPPVNETTRTLVIQQASKALRR